MRIANCTVEQHIAYALGARSTVYTLLYTEIAGVVSVTRIAELVSAGYTVGFVPALVSFLADPLPALLCYLGACTQIAEVSPFITVLDFGALFSTTLLAHA